jgi:hypothetical protein
VGLDVGDNQGSRSSLQVLGLVVDELRSMVSTNELPSNRYKRLLTSYIT